MQSLASGAPAASATLGGVSIFTAGLKEHSIPTQLVLGPGGDIWFADERNTPAIGRITPAGEIAEYTGPLTDESFPRGLAASGGYVWFVDRGSVGRVAPDGTIAEFRAMPDNESGPPSATPGPDGNVWFSEAGSDPAIGRVTPGGGITLFRTGLSSGSKPEELRVGPDGALWFVDRGTKPAIGRIAMNGEVTEFSSGLRSTSVPGGLTLGADGNLWFVEGRGAETGEASRVDRITPAGVIDSFPALTACPWICGVWGLTAGADGDLWFMVGHTDGVSVIRMTPAGEESAVPPGAGEPEVHNAGGFVRGAEGDLWFPTWPAGVAGGETALVRVTPGGGFAWFTAGLPGSNAPMDLTVGSDANLWFTDGSALGRLETSGVPAPQGTGPLVPSARKPVGSLSIRQRRLSVRGGLVWVPVTCTGTGECRGRLKLASLVRRRHHRRPVSLVLASASIAVQHGTTRTLRMRLSGAALAALKAHRGEWTVKLRIAKSSPAPTQTRTESVTLVRLAQHSAHLGRGSRAKRGSG